MSNFVTANRDFHKHVLDNSEKGFIFDCVLPAGRTIATVGEPTITTLSGTPGTALTVDNEQPNAAAFNDDEGNEVAVGRAVLADLAGGTAGCVYRVRLSVTDSSGDVFGGDFRVVVE